jgi:hypothetical protein
MYGAMEMGFWLEKAGADAPGIVRPPPTGSVTRSAPVGGRRRPIDDRLSVQLY